MSDGLSTAQACERLAQDGPNELPVSQPRSMLRLLRDVVCEPMFLLLAVCGTVYMLLGDRHEALMLLGFVVVVMGITFVQQRRSERSLEALRDLSSPRALVLRDGQPRRVPGRELVCGDVVLLAEGDRVPADLYVLESSGLAVDESLLTGESVPVLKQATPWASGTAVQPGDNCPAAVFSGTLVTQGTARGLVVATGVNSALGRIGRTLGGLGPEITPVQRETARVVKWVASAGAVLACVLALVYWLVQHDPVQGLLAGITLAMAVLPEELPVVLTLFLGLGAWRLAREKVLARRIPAVELLGATTVLCVDKTGTLTANRMAVRRLWSPVAMYAAAQPQTTPVPEALHAVLEFAVLASHRRAFDPMETAILEAGRLWLGDTEHLHDDWTLVEDYPLSADMLAMSRVWRSPSHHTLMIATKGAPEAVVDLCHLDAVARASIAAQVATLAGEGLRVLGVAQATFGVAALPGNQHDFAFKFLGLLALQDPVRPDVPQAIAECRAAGIRVVMMTGDHPVTAMSVARQVGLPVEDGRVMTGTELMALSDAELLARLADVHVFCRVQPEHKLRLVQAFQAQGEVVAMTGDGVNDAPALKAAHIGVAMGARGTDVAREAAALVLVDDDFASIVTAVRYGRRVFANLRKAIAFVVAVHVPIVGLSFMPVVLGWPMLLMPVHILFLQLIIDPACSVVFEAEPLEEGAMRSAPRRPDAKLFGMDVVGRALWQGMGLLAVLLALYAGVRLTTASDNMARTVTFTALVLSNLGLIYSNRSGGFALWRNAVLPNPYFRWVALTTTTVLAVVVGVPDIGRLFFFDPPKVVMLLLGVSAAGASWAWFEGVKWAYNSNV